MRFLKALFSSPPSMDAKAAKSAIRGGAQLTDVRERSEFARISIAGAINVPMDQLQASPEHALRAAGVNDKDSAPVIFVCQSGIRSRIACITAAQVLGDRAFNLRGGMASWESHGLIVERGDRR